jgi:hypothetical protein
MTSAFGLRRAVRSRVNAELGDVACQAALEAGAGRSPLDAFVRLTDALDQ